jgi:hypothetical protein
MIVVPLEKDIIKTNDGLVYRVVSYTNFKDNGPAVYCKNRGDKRQTLVYFFDIAYINDTKVDYHRGSKLFNALGKIARVQHLPQPDDKIITMVNGEKRVVEVVTLKLKSKNHGVNKGILVKDSDDNFHRLKSIHDIDPALGGSRFNRKEFLEYYEEYLGV